jgi:hypothetical protein
LSLTLHAQEYVVNITLAVQLLCLSGACFTVGLRADGAGALAAVPFTAAMSPLYLAQFAPVLGLAFTVAFGYRFVYSSWHHLWYTRGTMRYVSCSQGWTIVWMMVLLGVSSLPLFLTGLLAALRLDLLLDASPAGITAPLYVMQAFAMVAAIFLAIMSR